MIASIDDKRAIHGVEPICKVLPIAPSTYHVHIAKREDPLRLSARRDAVLRIEVRRVFEANFRVYGVRKVWRQLRRDVARCTVARLMRAMGLAGVIRGKPVRTLIGDRSAPCPLDRVAEHKVDSVGNAARRPAWACPIFRPTAPTSVRSSRPSPKSKRCSGAPLHARSMLS